MMMMMMMTDCDLLPTVAIISRDRTIPDNVMRHRSIIVPAASLNQLLIRFDLVAIKSCFTVVGYHSVREFSLPSVSV